MKSTGLRPSWGWLALALGLAGVLAVAAWGVWTGAPSRPTPAPREAALPPASLHPAAPARPAVDVPAMASAPLGGGTAVAVVEAQREAPSDAAADDLAAHIPAGQVPTMQQVIEGLHARGIRTGLGAFNPPGTRPPLIGLAVPEDFVLPPGYLRHHQATDDGQRIEAILMFAPDFRLFDAQGREIPLPENRVVPPELAPPGLPLRRITLPAPATEPRP